MAEMELQDRKSLNLEEVVCLVWEMDVLICRLDST